MAQLVAGQAIINMDQLQELNGLLISAGMLEVNFCWLYEQPPQSALADTD
jgi:hypothetical protein